MVKERKFWKQEKLRKMTLKEVKEGKEAKRGGIKEKRERDKRRKE